MGSRRLTRSGFTSTDEANDALQEALKQRKQNEKFGNKVPTVGTYVDEWVAGLKLAASTITGYKKIIRNHIRPQLGTIRLDKLTATRIARHYRDTLEDELFPLWRLIAYTGMRRSEALTLKWSEINAKTMRVSIRGAVDTDDWTKTKTTKTGGARVIDVDADTLKVLASYKVARAEVSFELAKADAYVFGDDDGKLRSPDAMTSRWDRRLKWATAKFDTLHRVTTKGLRHTHATLLLDLGEHPKVVQERLGHSTITTTMNIYSHVTPTMQRSAVDRFAAHLGKA